MAPMKAHQPSTAGGAVAEVRVKWSWFVALGIIYIVAGIIAASNLLLVTLVTVYFVGVLMVIAGVVQIIHAFNVKLWNGFLWWLLSSVLYVVAGVLAFLNPFLASWVITLVLATLISASGVSRLWLGLRMTSEPGWGWIVASGLVTTIAGLIFLLGWPLNSLGLLGLILVVDLIFQGCAVLAFGLRLRRAA